MKTTPALTRTAGTWKQWFAAVVCLSVPASALLFPHGGRALAQGKANAPDGRLQKLQRERVETLEQMLKFAQANFTQGLASGREVHQWQRELASAKLELCTTKAERIAVLTTMLEAAQSTEKGIRNGVQIGRRNGYGCAQRQSRETRCRDSPGAREAGT